MTPDGDEWVIDLSLSEDIWGLRLGTARWVLPHNVGGHVGAPVYRFPRAVTAGERDAFFGRCVKLVKDRRAEALGDQVEEVVVDPGEDAKPGAPTRRMRLKGPAAALPDAPSGDGRPQGPSGFASMNFSNKEWISVAGAKSEPGVVYSADLVKTCTPLTVLHNFALITEGEVVTVLQSADVGSGPTLLQDMQAALEKAGGKATPRNVDDSRILPTRRNKAGRRYMSFQEQVQTMMREEFSEGDWLLVGPRSSPYCLGEVSRLNTGMVARSTSWRHENNIQDDSHFGSTHELISEAIEMFVCVDQLDAYNSTGVETLMRQLQFVEYEVKKKREAKAPTDGAHYFRGRFKMTGGAIIDPELLRWIASKASQDSAILKEQRKAAEEQALAKKKAPDR